MRIGFDVSLLYYRTTGVERAAYSLISALIDQGIRPSMFAHKLTRGPKPVLLRNLEHQNGTIPIIPFGRGWTDLILPMLFRLSGIQIHHCLAGGIVKVPSYCNLYTVYDLACWKVPQFYSKSMRDAQTEALCQAIRNSDHYVVISESTKRDFCEIFSISPEKVSVIYLGVDESFFTISASRAKQMLSERLGIGRDFILSTGIHHPRKNVLALLDAYDSLMDEGRLDHDLLLVGETRETEGELRSRISQSPHKHRILVVGFLPEDTLRACYAACSAFVFASKYEGFGLPVLEAMATGCPVVAGDNSSIPEIAGDTCRLFKTDSKEELREALRGAIQNDQDAASRARRIDRARQFTWEKSAKSYLALYETIGA